MLLLLSPLKSYTQHLSLIEYKGELGTSIGTTAYKGQIGGKQKTYHTNFSLFYRKLLSNNFGVRFNYEYIPLEANDMYSNQSIINNRGFRFNRTFHEMNILFEYFLRKNKITDIKNKLNPFLGIGMGYILNLPTNENNFVNYKNSQQKLIAQFWPICTIPINIGICYKLGNDLNIFGEFTFRYTTSDLVDNFETATTVTRNGNTYTAENNGNDKFYSVKLGLTTTLIKRFAPDKK